MPKLLIVTLVAVLVLPVAASGLEQIVHHGYSYFTPPEQVGTVTTLVGFLEPPVGFTYPFSVDFSTNEYTFYFQSTIQSITPLPVTTEYAYATTTFEIYEDPAKNAAYGSNPPNGTAPSTFRDGMLILSGTMSGLLRIDYNFGFPEPAVIATIDWDGGSKLGEVAPFVNDWTFHGGVSSDPGTGIPTGYQRSWSCEMVQPTVPVEESSWGRIKALYAGE